MGCQFFSGDFGGCGLILINVLNWKQKTLPRSKILNETFETSNFTNDRL